MGNDDGKRINVGQDFFGFFMLDVTLKVLVADHAPELIKLIVGSHQIELRRHKTINYVKSEDY